MPGPPPGAVLPSRQRIASIDILRGAVMIIMALDHVRDFLHIHGADDTPTNLATTTAALFFTRWITHFCAPVFVFLSGTSAFLSGQRQTKAQLSAGLVKRGCWLIFIEVLLVTPGWTFDPLYSVLVLQVIWAIGWGMVILGLMVRLPLAVIASAGLVLVFGHNLLDTLPPGQGAVKVLGDILLRADFVFYPLGGGHSALVLYTILPWTGVMLLGYGLGYLYRRGADAARRRSFLWWTGVAVVLLFMVLRYTQVYGDPAPWSPQKNRLFTLLSFLNTTKYPPSLLYLSMTLGPALMALALLEGAGSRVAEVVRLYGRVPFFYYVCHIFLIHAVTLVCFYLSGFGADQIRDPASIFLFRPAHFGYSLGAVYMVWAAVVAALYLPVRWYNRYKSSHDHWWLRYC